MKTDRPRLALGILPVSAADKEPATLLATQLGYPWLPVGTLPEKCTDYVALLLVDAGRLYLQQAGANAPGPIVVDFDSGTSRYRRLAGGPELLGRAVGLGRKQTLQVLDATAGLGRDALVLTTLGAAVTLCEREPVLAAMLESGMQHASSVGLEEMMSRMSLCSSDARTLDEERLRGVDVIYLDPMFPGREKSAAVKKEMALLQRLLEDVGAAADADDLLLWACEQDVARVVVKRPLRASCLANSKPSHCVKGKAVRYDVYVKRKLS